MKKYILILSVLVLASCQMKSPQKQEDDLLLATLFNYYSAEYKALAFQAYGIATNRIVELHETRSDDKNMAIVLDIDETVLDNSPYQAKLILEGIEYDSCWTEWCNLANARAIPGVLEFLNTADSLGFNIFYLSNRKDKTVKEGTMENMKNLDFPQCREEHFLLRTESSSKQNRRDKIEENYEIVLLCGDNLGDFYEDEKDAEKRNQQVEEFQSEFGKKFIVLPNAMYGSWLSALNMDKDREKIEELLRKMTGDGQWCSQ